MGHAFPVPEEFIEALVTEVVKRVSAGPARRLLSKVALADHYGVGTRTIKTWREKGCPAYKVGRDLMFNVDEVDRWLERHPA